MKILIACEFSGIVREAFKKRGHDAWSCDLLPTEIPGNHIHDDVVKYFNNDWDMMIAHPPCTYLSFVGLAHWNKPGREEERKKAMDFFMLFINAPIGKICVENPVGLPNRIYRKPDQIIHPYYFGDRQLKRTCLWLQNLPKLEWRKENDLFGQKTATDYPEPIYRSKRKNIYFTEAMHGSKIRSRFWPNIAKAMAEQWG